MQIQKDYLPIGEEENIPGAAQLLYGALPLMAALKTIPLYAALTTASQLQPKNLLSFASATARTREIMAADFATFIFNAKQSVAAIDLSVAIQQELASIAGSTEVASLGGAENVKKILVPGVEAAAELCLPIEMMVPMAWRPGEGNGGLNMEAFLAQAQGVVAQNEPPLHRTLEEMRKHGVPLMQVRWDGFFCGDGPYCGRVVSGTVMHTRRGGVKCLLRLGWGGLWVGNAGEVGWVVGFISCGFEGRCRRYSCKGCRCSIAAGHGWLWRACSESIDILGLVLQGVESDCGLGACAKMLCVLGQATGQYGRSGACERRVIVKWPGFFFASAWDITCQGLSWPPT